MTDASHSPRWPPSLATTVLGGSLPEQLHTAARAGFPLVEVFGDDLSPGLTGANLRRELDQAGVELSLLQPLRDVEGVPAASFEAALDRARALFDFAADAGAPGVLVCSSVAPDAIDDPGLSAAQLSLVAEHAAERGLWLVYEALSWGRHVRTWRQAWTIVQAAGQPNLRLGLDSFHTLALRDDFSGIGDLPAGAIGFLQLADAPWSDLDPRRWSRNLRCFPGEGELDVLGLARAALEAGYVGPLSLEVFNPAVRALPPAEVAARAMTSLRRLAAGLGVSLTGGGARE